MNFLRNGLIIACLISLAYLLSVMVGMPRTMAAMVSVAVVLLTFLTELQNPILLHTVELDRTLSLADGSLYLKLKIQFKNASDDQVRDLVHSWFAQTEILGTNKISSYSGAPDTLRKLIVQELGATRVQVRIVEQKATPLPPPPVPAPVVIPSMTPEEREALWLKGLSEGFARDLASLAQLEKVVQETKAELSKIIPDWQSLKGFNSKFDDRVREARSRIIGRT